MRIALCISGQVRHGMASFPYIYNSFLNNDYEVDVFFHTWNRDEVIDLYNPEFLDIENDVDIRKSLLDNLNLHKDVKVDKTSNIGNNLLMYYGIKRVISMVGDEYDIVIRARPDMFMPNKLNLKKIVSDITSGKYDIQIPSPQFNFGGYNDQLAIGSYESMKVYGDFINNIEKTSNTYNKWHSETLLKLYLDYMGVSVNQIEYDYRLLRTVKITVNKDIFERRDVKTEIAYE